MRILLDTCTFLWLITDADNPFVSARNLFVDPGNDVFLSAVSGWELSVRYGLGRLPLPEAPERFVPVQRERHGIIAVALEEQAALYFHKLPPLHRDPFDRMLICQAIHHEFTLLTPDPLITQNPVRTAW